MKSATEFLDDLWEDSIGVRPPRGLDLLRLTEWSPRFERLMRNRLIMGALRYGRLGSEGKPKYDRIESIRKRLNEYERAGNDELLVDVANLCVLEFEEGEHPTKHFRAIDDGEHARKR